MINLLPPLEKERLLTEKKKRIVIILWLLFLFFLVCLILILFAIEIYIKGQVEAQKILSKETEKELGQSELKEIKEKLKAANTTLAALDSFYQKRIYFTDILERISRTLPSEVYLTNLSATFSSTEEGDGIKVSLSGFSPTQEKLLEFLDNLDEEDGFEKVYFPTANWVKDTDIDLFVTFEIKIGK